MNEKGKKEKNSRVLPTAAAAARTRIFIHVGPDEKRMRLSNGRRGKKTE